MERHTIRNKKSSQWGNQLKVSTKWQHTQEPNPAFRRLMMLLLKPVDNQSAETIQAVEEQQNE